MYMDALGGLESAKLSEDEQMSRDVLKWECELNLKLLQFRTHLLPVDQFNCSLHLTPSTSSPLPFERGEVGD